jgi:GNAT acetyltransferase-like protein
MSYTVEIDDVEQRHWHRLLREFEDATIFQTWAYGSARWGKENLSHAVIKKHGEVVGLAQSILVGIPLLGRALALVIFGPIWQRRGALGSIEHLQGAVNALRQEYAGRRRLCLRLRPWPYDFSQQLAAAMLAEGTWRPGQHPPTYILDLARSECELRRSMDKKWRANLRRAEQCALTVSQENERDGIRIFAELHGEMRERKQSIASDFVDMLPALYDGLPEDLKPKIFVCWRGTEPAASAIVSAIGSKAFYLNGASGNSALEVRAGYILQWAIVRWLKETGMCRWYDLNGAMSSPGVRQFKRGLVGAKAPEIPINEFEACESHLAAFIVRSGSRLNERYRNRWLRSKWLRR